MHKPCNKVYHATAADAQKHLDHIRIHSREHPVRLARLAVYHCSWCRNWHIGHKRPWRRDRPTH